jgi:hypothetical protein
MTGRRKTVAKNIRLSEVDREVLLAAQARGVWFCTGDRQWLLLKPKTPKPSGDELEEVFADMPVEHNVTATVRHLKNLGLLESREVSQTLRTPGIPSYTETVEQKQYKVILALLTPAGRAAITSTAVRVRPELAEQIQRKKETVGG